MISITSNSYNNLINYSNDVYIKIELTATGGSPLTRTITNDDIVDRQFSFTDSLSQEDKLEIGSCIINQMTVTITNDDNYSGFQYAGAQAVLYIGRQISENTVEYIQKGIYYVIYDGYYSDTITLTCYDRMVLLDKPFDSTDFYDNDGNFNSCTLDTLFTYFLAQSGVTCSYILENPMFSIQNVSGLNNITLRQLLQYICQIEGKNARFNNGGDLEFKIIMPGISKLDANIVGTVYVVDNLREGDPCLIQATAINNMQDGTNYRTGGETVYTLVVEGNPLIRRSTAPQVTNKIESIYKNKHIKPFSCRIVPNELLEAGDKVKIITGKGDDYPIVSCITNIEYVLGEPETVMLGAETIEQNKTNRGVSQIEFELKNIRKRTQGIVSIKKHEDIDGRITKLEYNLEDGSKAVTNIEYDTEGKIKKIGGVNITV